MVFPIDVHCLSVKTGLKKHASFRILNVNECVGQTKSRTSLIGQHIQCNASEGDCKSEEKHKIISKPADFAKIKHTPERSHDARALDT